MPIRIAWLVVGVVAFCSEFAIAQRDSVEPPRPNIVLIMADDLGYSDIGCYGGEIDTPNLDALAANGMRFTQFYNNAKCAPTRASLLTGQYSQRVGVFNGPVVMQHCVTLAEVLREAGYRTLMTGKWHAEQLPVERGFDRYYGLCDGCCNFFNPGEQRAGELPPAESRFPRKWADDDTVMQPYTPEDPDFYTTDAFTDRALGYLDAYAGEEKPFFLYLAYTAPHFPLHAPEEDIEKYLGTYMRGWDALREERYKRMIEMGLIDDRWPMSPREDRIPAWDDVEDLDAWNLARFDDKITPEWAVDRKRWDRLMATYAAMVDRMDRNIGRLLAKLRELDEFDNTIVLFLSDNGACAEFRHAGSERIGPLDGYHTVDPPWANLQNTPYRWYKRYNFEGGIATPFIAHWPDGIEPGTITHQPAHIIDMMATALALSGGSYPERFDSQAILPYAGRSLAPIFDGETRAPHAMLFWNFTRAKAVRAGKWKAVTDGNRDAWELYDLEADRTELHNLADDNPLVLRQLVRAWDNWRETWDAGEDLE